MIFLVDTNTFCEAAKPEPNRRVLSRLVSRQFDWATSATAWEEFLAGIGALPRSERRNKLEAYRESLLDAGLDVLPFDRAEARRNTGVSRCPDRCGRGNQQTHRGHLQRARLQTLQRGTRAKLVRMNAALREFAGLF